MPSFVPLHPYLQQQLRAGQLSHAYIFSGDAAAEQAEALAAALECLTPVRVGQACGECQACHNIRQHVHPDVRYISPQGSQHKVESIRDLVGDAGLSRMAGAFKVYILESAESITVEGANTLLKLLEEPVPNTVLLLLAEQPDALLPTIRSRCQQFNFGSGEKCVQTEPELAVAAAEFLQALPGMPLYQVLQRARDFEKDRLGQSSFLFAMLEQLHRRAKGEPGLPWSRQAALKGAETLEEAMDKLERGINQKLLIDVCYLRLRQICAG